MVIVGFFIAMVILTIIRGVTIDQFWDWFLIDPGAPFHGQLPAITTAEALGLSLIVSVFMFSTTGSDADNAANQGKSIGEVLLHNFLMGLILYGLWWVFALIIKGWI